MWLVNMYLLTRNESAYVVLIFYSHRVVSKFTCDAAYWCCWLVCWQLDVWLSSVVSVLLRLFVWDVTTRVEEISVVSFFEFLVLICQDMWQTIGWSCGTFWSQDFNKWILWFYLWVLISYKHLPGSSLAVLIFFFWSWMGCFPCVLHTWCFCCNKTAGS
jgi:hypothetical protein